jgi:hypothetical protein
MMCYLLQRAATAAVWRTPAFSAPDTAEHVQVLDRMSHRLTRRRAYKAPQSRCALAHD